MKLTRDSFSALRETAIVLDEQEQRAVKGGDYWDDYDYYTSDSSGNITWTRTSTGDGVYYSGSSYDSDSGSGDYPGEGWRDCAIQAVANLSGKSIYEIHGIASQVLQDLYGYSSTSSGLFAGNGLDAREIEELFKRVMGNCYSNSYNSNSQDSSIQGIGLINGHVVTVHYYYSGSLDMIAYYDPQEKRQGTAPRSSFDQILTGS